MTINKSDCSIDKMWDGDVRVTLKGGLSDEIIEYFSNKVVDYVVIKDGNWSNLDRLLPFKDKIMNVSIKTQQISWELISSFTEIEKLMIGGTFKRCNIDFSKLKKLKNLKAYWNGGFEGALKNIMSLKTLSIINYAEENVSFLGEMNNLEYFELINSRKLNSIKGISSFKKLKYLALDGCPNLKDFSDIISLKNIKLLSITKCNKENDYSVLKELTSLNELFLGGEIKNIKWVKNLVNLNSLRMGCKIDEGDLNFLYEMPSLQLALFNDRKNFSIKLKDIQSYLANKGFNQEELRMGGMQFSDGYK